MTALSTHLYIEREGPCVYYQYCSMECIMILDSLPRLYHNVQSLRARGSPSRHFHRTFVQTFRHANKLKLFMLQNVYTKLCATLFSSLFPFSPPFFLFLIHFNQRTICK